MFSSPPLQVVVALAALIALRLYWNKRPSRVTATLAAALASPEASGPAATPGRGRWAWPLAGGLFLLATLTFWEITQPFFFAQDDVVALEMPVIVAACRSLWNGVIFHYNAYLAMGTPAIGIDYPPHFLSYAIARHLLGNEYLMMEVHAFGHLLAGYLATYALGRALGVRPWIATTMSLAFILSGGLIIMGRSWHSFITVALYLPLLFLLFKKLIDGAANGKWALITGVTLGLFYHVSFPQLLLFALVPLLACLGVALALRMLTRWQLVWTIPATILGIGIALPLIFMHFRAASDISQGTYGTGVGTWPLLSTLLPYPLVTSELADGFLPRDPLASQFYFFGGAVLALLAALALGALIAVKVPKSTLRRHIWAVGLLVCLDVVVLGRSGLTLRLLHLTGQHNLLHYPWRMLPYLALFAIVEAGLLLEGLLVNRLLPRSVTVSLGVATVALLLVHISLPLPAFCQYGYRPYPELPQELRTLVLNPDGSPNGRILPIHPFRSGDADYYQCLCSNLPAVYGAASIKVYDPIVERSLLYRGAIHFMQEDFAAGLRAWNVRWILVSKSTPSDGRGLKIRDLSEFKVVLDLPAVRVHEVPNADPWAFVEGQHEPVGKVVFDGGGIHLTCAPAPTSRRIIINALAISDLFAYVDGQPVRLEDEPFGRLRLDLPPHASRVDILYQPPWLPSIGVGALLAVFALYLIWRLPGRIVAAQNAPQGPATPPAPRKKTAADANTRPRGN